MTEVSPSLYRPITRHQAAEVFDASPNLRDTITGLMSEKGQRAIGLGALTLSSRPLVFDTLHSLQEFSGTVAERTIPRGTRFDVLSDVRWRTITRKGYELNRVYFRLASVGEAALRNLYDQYRSPRFIGQDVTPEDPNSSIAAGTLALTLPTEFLSVSSADGEAAFNDALIKKRQDRGALFANNSRLRSERMS